MLVWSGVIAGGVAGGSANGCRFSPGCLVVDGDTSGIGVLEPGLGTVVPGTGG